MIFLLIFFDKKILIVYRLRQVFAKRKREKVYYETIIILTAPKLMQKLIIVCYNFAETNRSHISLLYNLFLINYCLYM